MMRDLQGETSKRPRSKQNRLPALTPALWHFVMAYSPFCLSLDPGGLVEEPKNGSCAIPESL